MANKCTYCEYNKELTNMEGYHYYHRSEIEFAKLSFNEWLEHEKKLNLMTPKAIKFLLKVRSFLLNKQLVENEDFKMGTSGFETEIVVGIDSRRFNVRLLLDILEFLHVPFKKYDEVMLFTDHCNVRFWDFICIIIPETCYQEQSYQTNLM